MNCDEYLMKQIEELKKQLHEQQIEYDKKIDKLQSELLEIKEKSIADKKAKIGKHLLNTKTRRE